MFGQGLFSIGSVAVIASVVGIAAGQAGAQTAHTKTSVSEASQAVATSTDGRTDKPYDWRASFAKISSGKVPRTPDGKPDMQGIWSFSILTPLERPGGQQKDQLSREDAQAEEEIAQDRQKNLRIEPTNTPPGEKTTDAYNTFWRDGYWYKAPMTTLHTSQVVDPSDGRVPVLTTAAKERLKEYNERLNRPATGPEDRPTTSRCLRSLTSGPPFIGAGPGSQETTLEIIQGSEAVVVRESMDSQIIPLGRESRPAANVHLDKGVARGHWDGDTLIVESTNFTDYANGFFSTYGTTEKMRLVERWKLLDKDHLLYGFTMDDPATWTKPWSVEFVMWRLPNQEEIVEYACHAGNVGLGFTLSAARTLDTAHENAIKAGLPNRSEGTTPVRRTALRAIALPLPSRSNDLGMDFVMIPPGEFQMGCSEGAKANECSKDELPRHSVQITRAFEIQKTEVTEKQWAAVMGSNPSAYKGENLPVENITFEQIQDFLAKLNAQNDGFLYRLPTEAEWEYAARAGTSDPYSGAMLKDAMARFSPADDLAWYNIDKTRPVATKKPNEWGIYDMRGNVAEWVQDFYDPDYYLSSPKVDPSGPSSGDLHVARGGFFHAYPWLTRVSLRSVFPATYQFYDLGFRVACESRNR